MTTTTATDGNGTTHFFDVVGRFSDGLQLTRIGPHQMRLSNADLGRAMLFIPRAVSSVGQVPMLIYYHGHHGPKLIEGYIAGQKERDFRPLLKSTKVLLLEPQGGPVSKFGALGDPAHLDTLIDRAMYAALTVGPLPARPVPKPTPKPQSIIFAGFSGGGATLKNVVIGVKADYVSRITEVWCFDCMYSGEGKKWVDWATTTKKTLRVRVSNEEGTGAPRAQAKIIRDTKAATPMSDNIDIADVTKSSHEALPSKFIPGWLAPQSPRYRPRILPCRAVPFRNRCSPSKISSHSSACAKRLRSSSSARASLAIASTRFLSSSSLQRTLARAIAISTFWPKPTLHPIASPMMGLSGSTSPTYSCQYSLSESEPVGFRAGRVGAWRRRRSVVLSVVVAGWS